MVYVFNAPGALTAIVGLFIGFVIGFFLSSPGLAIILAALIWIGMDLVIRCRENLGIPKRRRHSAWLIWPSTGGHIWFIPVWGLGIVLLFVGLMVFAAKPFYTSGTAENNNPNNEKKTAKQPVVPLAGTLNQQHFKLEEQNQGNSRFLVLTNTSGQDLYKVKLSVVVHSTSGTQFQDYINTNQWPEGRSHQIEVTLPGFFWNQLELNGEVYDKGNRRFTVDGDWKAKGSDVPVEGNTVFLGLESFQIQVNPSSGGKTTVQVTNKYDKPLNPAAKPLTLYVSVKNTTGGFVKPLPKSSWEPNKTVILTYNVKKSEIDVIRFQGKVNLPDGKEGKIHCEWDAKTLK